MDLIWRIFVGLNLLWLAILFSGAWFITLPLLWLLFRKYYFSYRDAKKREQSETLRARAEAEAEKQRREEERVKSDRLATAQRAIQEEQERQLDEAARNKLRIFLTRLVELTTDLRIGGDNTLIIQSINEIISNMSLHSDKIKLRYYKDNVIKTDIGIIFEHMENAGLKEHAIYRRFIATTNYGSSEKHQSTTVDEDIGYPGVNLWEEK